MAEAAERRYTSPRKRIAEIEGPVFGVGPGELLLVALLAFLIVGPERTAELAGLLGQAYRSFQAAWADLQAAWEEALNETSPESGRTAASGPAHAGPSATRPPAG